MTYPSYPAGGSQPGQQLPYFPQPHESLGAYPGPYYGGPAGMGAAPLSFADLGSRLGAPLWCCWDKPLRQCLHDKVADNMTLDV
ncbi:hypothetical protein [Streptomyces sp. R41]|uniref:Uncharacterized protein n=1 Tax=Streptomyces sp. R41 TaxID=3238632 RepID=A0AB39RPA2_9ACTN